MRLSELIAGLNCQIYNFKDIKIESIEFDSRQIRPGALFIAIKGNKYDGHKFIKQAEELGAVALVTQERVDSLLPQVVCNDTREFMGKIAKNFYGNFSDLKIIGVTGTNGKTTTAFLIYSILKQAGFEPGLIGTIYYIGKDKRRAERTTPESLELFKLIDDFQKDGAKFIVMEVSSHALALKRVEELKFHIAIFTNLSQDHLDFHKTMADYKKAKLHLFDLLESNGYALYNQDDPVAEDIRKLNIKNCLSYGFDKNATLRGEIKSDSIAGLKLDIFYQDRWYEINSKLLGTFNSYNILASFAAGVVLGLDVEVIKNGIETLECVRGRMERVADNIFVDFAHTPVALENLLKSMRKYTSQRLIIIFGCGGDRDQKKRPEMGRIASENADFVIITSDNPRNENPEDIISDIIVGIKSNNYTVISDREEAIAYGIKIKNPEDILVIAGKGHEAYQIIGNKIIPFDDAQVVKNILGRKNDVS